MDLVKSYLRKVKDMVFRGLSAVAPSNLKRKLEEVKRMSPGDLAAAIFKLAFYIVYYGGWFSVSVIK